MTTTWHNFLVEHAKFPFPDIQEARTVSSADISEVDVGLIAEDWKAIHVMPDTHLVPNLCQTLENILGNDLISEVCKEQLQSRFGHHVEYHTAEDGEEMRNSKWCANSNESDVRNLIRGGAIVTDPWDSLGQYWTPFFFQP